MSLWSRIYVYDCVNVLSLYSSRINEHLCLCAFLTFKTLIDNTQKRLKIMITFSTHCQKLGTRWRLRVRTKATMAANSYKKMYGDKETFSNISIMSSRVFGARLETC